MSSVTAFNDMMGQFLAELHKTFPEEKGIKKCMSGFEIMRSSNQIGRASCRERV